MSGSSSNFNKEDERLKTIHQELFKKDKIYNIIYKDLCGGDELGATLKLYLIAELYIQNDHF